MREYVVAMYVKGDAAETALSFLARLEEAAQDDESRKAVQSQIRRTLYERDASILDAAVEAWVRRHGAPPRSLDRLVEDGLIRALPADPYGGRFVVGEDGRVRSTEFSQRFQRPLSGAERQAILDMTARTIERSKESER